MKQVVWMAVGCVGSGLVAALLFGHRTEILLGMLAPLAASAATWLAAERAFRQDPVRVTSVLMGAFGAKLLLFGAYVVTVTRVWPVDAVPFVASFVVYFIGLQIATAALVRGLAMPQAS